MRNDGAMCFSWTDEFRNLPEGYYEGDIFIDGCECLTLLFYLPPCQMRVLGHEVEYDDGCSTCHTCHKAMSNCECNTMTCDRMPQYDEEYKPIPTLGCGDCEEC